MVKDKKIRVNVCWSHNDKTKCETMDKEHAYALKKWLDENGGYTFWFQALDD